MEYRLLCSGHAKCLSIVDEVNSTLSFFVLLRILGLVCKKGTPIMNDLFYQKPDIDLVWVSCEQGFSLSNMEPIEDENPPQYW